MHAYIRPQNPPSGSLVPSPVPEGRCAARIGMDGNEPSFPVTLRLEPSMIGSSDILWR